MAKLTNVYCTYTGGNIYVVTAKYGDVYLVSDLDPQSYGTYDVPYDDIEEEYEGDYDGHWKNSSEPLPTWGELLEAIRDSYERGESDNMDMGEVEGQFRYLHPDLSVRLNEPDPEVEEPDDEEDDDDEEDGMIICYRDDIGLVTDKIDMTNSAGVAFDGKYAYFTDTNGTDHKVLIKNIVMIGKEQ